jgi:hypothetical protein
MKTRNTILIVTLLLLSVSCTLNKKSDWKIAANPILTQWASQVDPSCPWPEYPRPDLVRDKWINMNGSWQYAITDTVSKPAKWDGNILVPYPLESALSGVKKRLSENENLWYEKTFKLPSGWSKKQILLNFEACDWKTTVWIDGKIAGIHKGGYDPFTFNITELLAKQKEHEILVCVWDPTDKGTQPRGKQVSNPGGIWYTPTSGIWHTVWIEPVNKSYIRSFRIVTNADDGTVSVKPDVVNPGEGIVNYVIRSKGKKIAAATAKAGETAILKIKDPVLWSPENPFLYDMNITLKDGSGVADQVKSYTGLRKVSLGKKDDFKRILLNNEFVWQHGPLDQGFWPDGIYTPPTFDAMRYDLEMTKKMGFNMLRKHVKVENRIFYYLCDKLGLMVWQDMPSGDQYIGGSMPDIVRSKESADQFELELRQMIETKYNHPSIVMWVAFNEGWGQFDTERITKLISGFDTTRLVNSASGWTDRGTGNVNDIHHYPEPVVPQAELNRAIVLGEYGGLGLPVEGHAWEKKNWGYRNMDDSLALLAKFEAYSEQIQRFARQNGLSASVYTQTTDVETETNGLMTYDRKIVKMGAENVFRANAGMTPPFLESSGTTINVKPVAILSSARPDGKIHFTTDGSEPDVNSQLYTGPVNISVPCVLKAFSIWEDGRSRTATYKVTQ